VRVRLVDDPRAEVGEDVRVGVGVLQLCVGEFNCLSYTVSGEVASPCIKLYAVNP